MALAIASALGRARLSYAIGGALANGFYGTPRATDDVDVNIFVDIALLPRVLDVLDEIGVSVLRGSADVENLALRDGMIVAFFGKMHVDIFVPSIAFSAEAKRTRVQHRIRRRTAWFLSAESITVFKLLFFRGKDQVDLEGIVTLMGGRLDHAYVRRWLVEMMGDDDERVRFWDRLVTAAVPPSSG